MNVLLTGFEPFNKEPINSSWESVRLLEGLSAEGAIIHTLKLPTVRGICMNKLLEGMAAWDPEVILCTGEAGGRSALSLERAAINCDDYFSPDNGGNMPVDEPIMPGGPAAYFSTLPIKKICKDLTSLGIPAEISNTAGTFVCNHLFYSLMDFLSHSRKERLGGFIHIPYLPFQAARQPGIPSMSPETITTGLMMAISVTVRELKKPKQKYVQFPVRSDQ